MNIITFKQEIDDIKLEMNITGDSNLTKMLESFELFLRGCGYVFDGQVTISDE